MTCSADMNKPKSKFHRRIDRFFSCADAFVCKQPALKVRPILNPLKLKKAVGGSLQNCLRANFSHKTLKSQRNKDCCANAVILNQAK